MFQCAFAPPKMARQLLAQWIGVDA